MIYPTNDSMDTEDIDVTIKNTEITIKQIQIKLDGTLKELKDTVQKLEKIAALTREDVLSRLKDAENYFKTDDYTEDR